MWIWTLWNHDLIVFQWCVVIVAALAAMVSDVNCRRIPNRLTGPLFGGGLLWAAWLAGGAGVADAMAGAVIMALPCLVLFLLAGGGAGDVKIMAALGAWLGVANGMVALLAVSLSGVVWGMGWALAQHQLRAVLSQASYVVLRPLMQLVCGGRVDRDWGAWAPSAASGTMPYAVAIFTGICFAATGVSLWRF